MDVSSGIHIRSRRGPIGDSWWARKWLERFEQKADANEVELGRRTARKSQVMDLKIHPGKVESVVAETRDLVFVQNFAFSVFRDSVWQTVLEELINDGYCLAMLYAGKLPEKLQEMVESAEAELFPEELPQATCTCEVELRPCRHIIAAACVMGERFDDDPFQLLQLHGRGRIDIYNAVRESWGAPKIRRTQESAPARLEAQLDQFFRSPHPLPTNSGTLELEMLDVLECLGYPPFFPQSDRSVQELLKELYDS